MIKSKMAFMIALLLFPLACFAGDFTASVDKNSGNLQDSIHLRLKLSNLQAQGDPNFLELENSFKIIDQQHSSVTNIINGKSTSSVVWDLTLLPLMDGQLTIPSISVSSSAGNLKTAPILVNVSLLPTAITRPSMEKGISFGVYPSKTAIYKNEPFVIQFELTANQTLRDVSLSDLSIKDAIVERQGEPVIQTRINSKGREQKYLLVSYLVTPLKDGNLDIPPLVVNAKVVRQNSQSPNDLDSLMPEDDGSDPFSQMQNQMNQQMNQMMKRFSQGNDALGMLTPTRSIAISSRPLGLKVLPPISGMSPWLPAQSLSLSDSWSGNARSGEPLTRTIITQATGLASSQLPGFEDQLNSNTVEKIYVDQPQFSQSVKDGKVFSSRKDVFTIIPQKTGEIRVPAVQLAWWDTIHHTKRVSTLPEKALQVAVGNARLSSTQSIAPVKVATAEEISPPSKNSASAALKYSFVLAAILALMCFSLYFSKRKVKQQAPNLSDGVKKPLLQKRVIQSCRNASEVLNFLQCYGETHWDLPAGSPLSKILATAEGKMASFDLIGAHRACRNIEDSLYGNRDIDIEALRRDVTETFLAKELKDQKRKTVGDLPELNPN